MAKEGQQPRDINAFANAAQSAGRGPPPVHLWNPPYCGEIDMRIATDGTWYYQKTPIGRPALVKLFASILKREGDRYYLVTPVEKCGIVVEDAPFIAVDVAASGEGYGRSLTFRTNVDDMITCGPEHRLRFEPEAAAGGLKPYLHVRRDLWARVSRSVYYELVDLGEERPIGGVMWYGVASQGEFFPLTLADNLKDLT